MRTPSQKSQQRSRFSLRFCGTAGGAGHSLKCIEVTVAGLGENLTDPALAGNRAASFSAPRDDTARESCRNGAKSDFAPLDNLMSSINGC
jgi:hypothetical protein